MEAAWGALGEAIRVSQDNAVMCWRSIPESSACPSPRRPANATKSALCLPHGNCKKALAASCARLGLPNFEPRSLRRFFITFALRAGVDVATVASWQGHKDRGSLILKTYNDVIGLAHSLNMAKRLAPGTRECMIQMKGAP